MSPNNSKPRAFLGVDETAVMNAVERAYAPWKEETRGQGERKDYYAGDLDLNAFREELTFSSLFSPKRFIVLHQIEVFKKKEWDIVIPIIARVAPEVELVLAGKPSHSFPRAQFAIERVYEKAEENLYQIFRQPPRQRYREIAAMVEENPYCFPAIIGACAAHLHGFLVRGALSTAAYRKKLSVLQDLDYRMKSGKIAKLPGWELLFLRILDLHS